MSYTASSAFLEALAEAGGAYAAAVKSPGEIAPALDSALHAVREERRSAVVDVWLPRLEA